jgi:hypothetical protein
MLTLRDLTFDWLAAQRKLQWLHSIGRQERAARSGDSQPDAVAMRACMYPPMDEHGRAQLAMAVMTQERECSRCGVMLAVNFEAVNDGGGDAPTAA